MYKGITLEVSLKPFKRTDDEYIAKVVSEIYDGWRPLIQNRECISVLMWCSDGSEILDYKGELDESFEWARFIGTANQPYPDEDEPEETSLHEKRRDYMKDAPKMTYRILKRIIEVIKKEGERLYPCTKIRVGETFDIGPEFAISDFKYRRHTEICLGTKIRKFGFVDATASLKADDYPYAAYPCGIPEGEPFGRFLGKQANVFLSDMGFDYLWLSNGLGFSANPWDKTGKIFDGERYYPEKLAATSAHVFDFWRLFREGCPDFPVETRGTNNSVGIDYASDGVPLYDIYNAKLNITPPPNSPWAAINDNIGLELMGHMSRTAELPGDVFPFRYYLHDPWWMNSPWYDRYDGAPYDLYLPMALSRISPEGRCESANTLGLLSIDNSRGDMPAICINEVIPHLLKAEKDAPDEPAPLVWVYPFREYTTAKSEELLREMNLGDNYIAAAINRGFPLSGVVSADSFKEHSPELYKKSILVVPAIGCEGVWNRISECRGTFVGIIIYGTREALSAITPIPEAATVCTDGDGSEMNAALERFGISIRHSVKTPGKKPPAMMISRSKGAHFFSVYNPDTTTETEISMPLGAPIMIGCECEIRDGAASYRFPRSEHREVRVFVRQKDGIISCREAAPGSARFRRDIRIWGLKDATVYFFPEPGCEAYAADVTPSKTPILDERFKTVYIEPYGECLYAEHIDGKMDMLVERIK